MFGGTAKTYATWKQECEPFKENGAFYINVINPKTNSVKKVRWYCDQAHANLMSPRPQNQENSFYKIFGFSDKDDYILCVKSKDLTQEEIEKYFSYNWKAGGKWTFGMFFGGIWYAPKNAEIPPIRNKEKVFKTTWPEFKKEGQKNLTKIGCNTNNSPWFV